MKANYIKENGKNIFISLIVGILLFYAQPLLNLFGDKIVNSLIDISSSFSNYYYSNVSQYNGNSLDWINNYLLILFLTFGLILGIQYFSDTLEEMIKKIEKTLKEITNEQLPAKEAKNEKEDYKDILNEIKVRIEKYKKNRKKMILTLILLSSLLLMFFYGNLFLTTSINNKNRIFDRQITILTPIVEKHKLDLLRAEWAQMTNIDDYNKINLEISILLKTK
ncbi:MAG: hypothetical protein Q7T72_01385 [Bacteroidales bacterium]|nr:hypothetical protein [Bacteroidales bacterium]